jgi:hypothetical protein
MLAVRNSFYGGDERWFADQEFIKRRVVTWPAHWLDERGVSMLPDDYRKLLLDVFVDIKRHGETGNIKYWPGYLAKCIQEHFAHHGEEIYARGKALRTRVDYVLSGVRKAPDEAQALRSVENLAQVHKALVTRRQARREGRVKEQLTLFS